MKKLLLVLAIGAFAACNNNSGSEETKTDSIPAVDTVTAPVVVDTTAPAAADTTAPAVDTTKK